MKIFERECPYCGKMFIDDGKSINFEEHLVKEHYPTIMISLYCRDYKKRFCCKWFGEDEE